jgi:hypothetical protein
MTTDSEYRQFAAECMRAAREAKTDTERRAFIDIVRAWTQAAAQTANGEAIAPPAAPASPKASP